MDKGIIFTQQELRILYNLIQRTQYNLIDAGFVIPLFSKIEQNIEKPPVEEPATASTAQTENIKYNGEKKNG